MPRALPVGGLHGGKGTLRVRGKRNRMRKGEWLRKLRAGVVGQEDGEQGREQDRLRILMLTRGGVGGRWVQVQGRAARGEEDAGRICSECSNARSD